MIITRSREPSTWRTAAFCPSLNQSREHGRFGSPSGRQRPRPSRAKSISRDSRASISFVVAICRPATSLRISGRSAISLCNALDRDRADAAFQGFGQRACVPAPPPRARSCARWRDRPPCLSPRSGLAATRSRRCTAASASRSLSVSRLSHSLRKRFPAQRACPSSRGSRPRVPPCGRDR